MATVPTDGVKQIGSAGTASTSLRRLVGMTLPIDSRWGFLDASKKKHEHQDKKLTNQVHEIVWRINGRSGTFAALPIHHLNKSIDFNTLCALYAVSDVALITKLRDGMSLVSHEYISCQSSKKGVLLLSGFAGAAESLGAGPLLVNPWNTAQVAQSILQALEMTSEERENRHRQKYGCVTSHTADNWAKHFLRELNDTVVEAQTITSSSSSQID